METEKLKEEILSLPARERERLLREVGGTLCPPRTWRHMARAATNWTTRWGGARTARTTNMSATAPTTGTALQVQVLQQELYGVHRHLDGRPAEARQGGGYLELMMGEDSLDEISKSLEISKKTAFDWRHKILAALGNGGGGFTGITESDGFFFLRSEKGMDVKNRRSRKRGGKSGKRGISNDQVAVIVTQDRRSTIDLSVATLGRISKADLEGAIGERIKKGSTILCSDAHHSYKGFARDTGVEFHSLNASKGERVKGAFHIQHVNSTHNRVRKWLGSTFWGVSTKYLQQYMDWHRLKEAIKPRRGGAEAFVKMTMNLGVLERFWQIQPKYENLISQENYIRAKNIYWLKNNLHICSKGFFE